MTVKCPRQSRSAAATAGRARRWSRPRLEALEDRLAPALPGLPDRPAPPPSLTGLISSFRQVYDIQLTAPAVVNVGVVFTLRIRPVDLFGQPRPTGIGAVRIFTDDPLATVPGLVTLGANSDAVDFQVVLRTPGQRTLTLTAGQGPPISRSFRIEVRSLTPINNLPAPAPLPPVFGGVGGVTGGGTPSPGLGESNGSTRGTVVFFSGPTVGGPRFGSVSGGAGTANQSSEPAASLPAFSNRSTPTGAPGRAAALLTIVQGDDEPGSGARRGAAPAGAREAVSTATGVAKTAGLDAHRSQTAALDRSADGGDPERLADLFRSLPATAGPLLGIATTSTSPAQAHSDARGQGTEPAPVAEVESDEPVGAGPGGDLEALDAAFLAPLLGGANEEAVPLELGLVAVALIAVEARRERRNPR